MLRRGGEREASRPRRGGVGVRRRRLESTEDSESDGEVSESDSESESESESESDESESLDEVDSCSSMARRCSIMSRGAFYGENKHVSHHSISSL